MKGWFFLIFFNIAFLCYSQTFFNFPSDDLSGRIVYAMGASLDGKGPMSSVNANTDGDLFVAWAEEMENGGFFRSQIAYRRYLARTQRWEESRFFFAGAFERYSAPQVSVNDFGEGIIVWQVRDTSSVRVHLLASMTTDNGVSWDPPQVISDLSGNVQNFQLAFNESGFGIVVWENLKNDRNFIQESHMEFGKVFWTSPREVAASISDSFRPSIALNNFNEAVVVYKGSTGDFLIGIGESHFAGVGSWQTSFLEQGFFDASDPIVTGNDFGNFFVIWNGELEERNVVHTAYSETGGVIWSNTKNIIDYAIGTTVRDPRIAMNHQNRAVGSWVVGGQLQLLSFTNFMPELNVDGTLNIATPVPRGEIVTTYSLDMADEGYAYVLLKTSEYTGERREVQHMSLKDALETVRVLVSTGDGTSWLEPPFDLSSRQEGLGVPAGAVARDRMFFTWGQQQGASPETWAQRFVDGFYVVPVHQY